MPHQCEMHTDSGFSDYVFKFHSIGGHGIQSAVLQIPLVINFFASHLELIMRAHIVYFVLGRNNLKSHFFCVRFTKYGPQLH